MSIPEMSRLEQAVNANSTDLLHYFQRRTDFHTASDLVAETMVNAWQREADLPDDDVQARMWLFGIARNTMSHAHRSKRRRQRLLSRLKLVFQPEEPAPSADDGAEVRDAVSRLDPELAELIRLVHWDGFSIADAGSIMNISASTARSRYQRAKQILRDQLQEEPEAQREYCPATLPCISLGDG